MTIPDWKVERYLLGELPAKEMLALKKLEKEKGIFFLQLEKLKESNKELLRKFNAREVANKMHANARNFTMLKKNKWAFPISAVAALLISTGLFFTEYQIIDSNSNTNIIAINEDGIRAKGLKNELEIWRKTTDSNEKLLDNSKAKEGDLLQIRYIVEKKCYGTILSMDGNGVLTVHFSGKNGKAAELDAGKIVSLANAYELDNAPEFEKFYFITSNNEFSLAPVAESILQDKMPKNLQIEMITLKK